MTQVLLDERLVLLRPAVRDRDELLAAMAERLRTCGAVREGFFEALMEREKQFPTGLPTEGVGIAIPHADAEFVAAPAVCVAVLADAVPFRRMDNPAECIGAHVVLMLALNNPDAQIRTLQRLAQSIQDSEFWQRMRTASSTGEVIGSLRMLLPSTTKQERGE